VVVARGLYLARHLFTLYYFYHQGPFGVNFSLPEAMAVCACDTKNGGVHCDRII